MMNRYYFLAFVCFCFLPILSAQWSSIGTKTGVAGTKMGNQVALSADGNVVAMSSAENAGEVQVFDIVSTSFNPKGATITGTVGDNLRAIALSGDGNILAVGYPDNNDNANLSGKVIVYEFVSGNWNAIGSPLYGTANSDFGYDLAISSSGTRLVVGHRTSLNGSVSIYDYNGSNWVQVGATLQGDEANSNFGTSVDITADGSKIIVGSPLFGAANNGQVKVFEYDGAAWIQVGASLTGTNNGGEFGASVSISDTENTIVVGAPETDLNKGAVASYFFDGSNWVQKGSTFIGTEDSGEMGRAVDISYSGDTLTFTIPRAAGGSFIAGEVLVYAFNDCQAQWDTVGTFSLGINDRMGNDVKLSRDGERIAIGSPLFSTDDRGQLSAFEITPPSVQELQVRGNNTVIVDGSTTISSTLGTHFDTAYIGNTSTNVSRIFSLKNIGDKDLIIDSLLVGGDDVADFAISGITTPLRLCQNDSTTFTVTFSPQTKMGDAVPAKLSRSATIQVYSNDPNAPFDMIIGGEAAGEATVRVTFEGNQDLHGTTTGDALLSYTATTGGNISNTATANTDGSGLNQGVSNGGNTAGLITVEPIGILENQIWYLFYEDASGSTYPVRIKDFAQNGTSIVTGKGTTPLTVQAQAEGSHTDYLFYVESPSLVLDDTPTFMAYQDSTGLPIDSFVQIDNDIFINDTDLQALNNAFSNYNNTSLSIERQGGAQAADIFEIVAEGDFTLSGNTILFKGDTLATYSTAGNRLVLNIASKTMIPTDSLVSDLLQLANYKNATDPLTSAIPLSFTYNNGTQAATVEKIVYPSPNIQSFTPLTGSQGDSITISGYNFEGVDTVLFGGVPASFVQVLDANTIRAVVGSGSDGFVTVQNKFGIDSLDGFIFDNITQDPILNEPDSNQSYVISLPISYTLPEALLSGSAKLVFTPESGPSITWQLADVTAATFNYTIESDPQTLPDVVSGAAVMYGIYSITLEYQDYLGNPVASVVHPNVTLSACESQTSLPVEACDLYNSPAGNTYTASGIYMDTLQNQYDCDSIITIDLTIVESDLIDTVIVACDSFVLAGGSTVYSSGIYRDTFTNQAGCDSIWQTDLTINTSYQIPEVISVCGSYTSPGGKVITMSGIYNDTLTSQEGCDSILNLDVTILQATSQNFEETVCDSFVSVTGKVLKLSGVYYDTLTNVAGCDSILTYDLTIQNSKTASLNIEYCTDYTTPSGKTLSTTGTYLDTISTIGGCDSIITINFVRSNSIIQDIPITACDSFRTPSGILYEASAIHRDTFTSITNCDSIRVYDITIHPSHQAPVTTYGCEMYTAPSGKVWMNSGIYQDTIQTEEGCDSILTITLTVHEVSRDTLEQTVCGSFTAPSGKVWTSSGSYQDTLTASTGCDSIFIYDLEIIPITETEENITECASYTLPSGKTVLETGIFYDTLSAVSGCDSIVQFDVVINPAFDTTYTVQTCGTYTSPWGMVLDSSGTYVDTMQTVHGCDSIVSINLVLGASKDTSIVVTACDQYTTPGGAVLDETQLWYDTIPAKGGCDSIIEIDLTVSYSNTFTMEVEKAGAYTSPSGAVYTISGIYVDTLTNVAGCDSLLTIDLTISETLDVAEAVSPNGDGVNDMWVIKEAENIENIELVILNRWGEVVYETKAYKNNWGGTLKDTGKKLPTGPYYYRLVISGKAQEGWIYITD